MGKSLVTDIDATAEAGRARANPLSKVRMPFRSSASVSENRAKWRERVDCREWARSSEQEMPLSLAHTRAGSGVDGSERGRAASWTWSSPSLTTPNLRYCADRPVSATGGRGAGRQSPSRQVGIQPERGCHHAVTRLYPPLARKRDRDRRAGAARLLLSSADFVSFRAPIDSIMDPGGRPRRPSDLLLSFCCGLGPSKGWKSRRLTRG